MTALVKPKVAADEIPQTKITLQAPKTANHSQIADVQHRQLKSQIPNNQTKIIVQEDHSRNQKLDDRASEKAKGQHQYKLSSYFAMSFYLF